MTASPVLPKERPTFLSVALTVFVAHLAFSLLLWFSGDHGELSNAATVALKILLFPVDILFANPRQLSDIVSLWVLIASWVLSGVLWSMLVAGSVWAWRKAYSHVIDV